MTCSSCDIKQIWETLSIRPFVLFPKFTEMCGQLFNYASSINCVKTSSHSFIWQIKVIYNTSSPSLSKNPFSSVLENLAASAFSSRFMDDSWASDLPVKSFPYLCLCLSVVVNFQTPCYLWVYRNTKKRGIRNVFKIHVTE